MQSLTSDSNANIRREALRSLETYKPKIEEVAALTKPLINDPHYMVKDQILRTLKNVKKANTDTIEILTTFAEPQKQKSAENIHPFGGSYEKNFQSFLSFMALEEYPEELSTFLDSPAAQKMPQANLNEAAKRLPKGQRAQKILTAIDNGSAQLDASNLSSLSPSLNEPKILNALKKQLQTTTFKYRDIHSSIQKKASGLDSARN